MRKKKKEANARQRDESRTQKRGDGVKLGDRTQRKGKNKKERKAYGNLSAPREENKRKERKEGESGGRWKEEKRPKSGHVRGVREVRASAIGAGRCAEHMGLRGYTSVQRVGGGWMGCDCACAEGGGEEEEAGGGRRWRKVGYAGSRAGKTMCCLGCDVGMPRGAALWALAGKEGGGLLFEQPPVDEELGERSGAEKSGKTRGVCCWAELTLSHQGLARQPEGKWEEVVWPCLAAVISGRVDPS
ncbi:hypothetical protein C8J57DRAFT_1242261 [Mycena rebaudengoi]|nr:hypothetical protein C8J57DRAFT_1242261 [Mycena rebaudengoi]